MYKIQKATMKAGILNKLTIVVPTFKRQNFALRLMDYWSDEDVNVLVLDGSPMPIDNNLLSDYPENISYLHQPVSIYKRLHNSLSLIKTDYVVLAGDDEFYIPSALESCLKKLDNDNDIVACCGRAIGFKVDNNKILGLPQYDSFANFNLDSECPIERVTRHMGEYVPRLIYSVCRTSSWIKIWEKILEKEFDFYAAGEIQFELCMCINGKSSVLPELMWLRSYGESNAIQYSDVSLNPKKRIDSWWSDEEKVADKNKFINIMSKALSEIGYKEKTAEIINHGIELYIEKNLKIENDVGRTSLKLATFGKMSQKFFNKISLRRDKLMKKTLYERAVMLSKSGVLVNFKSLKEIEKIICKHHNL